MVMEEDRVAVYRAPAVVEILNVGVAVYTEVYEHIAIQDIDLTGLIGGEDEVWNRTGLIWHDQGRATDTEVLIVYREPQLIHRCEPIAQSEAGRRETQFEESTGEVGPTAVDIKGAIAGCAEKGSVHINREYAGPHPVTSLTPLQSPPHSTPYFHDHSTYL